MQRIGLAFVFVIWVAGCNERALVVPSGETTNGVTGCAAHHDIAGCEDDPGCIVGSCCGQFDGCRASGDPDRCAADCADVCAGLDETPCNATAGCHGMSCDVCGTPYFSCVPDGQPTPVCASCPPPEPQPCDQLSTADACAARADCHRVYTPVGCGCVACCCTPYNRCAAGKPDCVGPALCKSMPPDCNEPACGGMFAVGFANSCYDGCVLAADCQP